MSRQDLKWVFSDAQAITSVGDTDGTDTVDIGRTSPRIGGGTPLWFNAVVNTLFTSSGSATLLAKIEHGTTNALGTTLVSGVAIAKASLTAGKVLLSVPLPPECLRHIGAVFTVGVSAMTAGKVDAWIGTSPVYDP